MTGKVWAENAAGKLEQRTVTLGMYDDMTGCYEILSGITAEDYLADPANPGSVAGAAVSRRAPEDFSAGAKETAPDETEESYDTALPTAPEQEGEAFSGEIQTEESVESGGTDGAEE